MQALERKCKDEKLVDALIINGYYFVFHLKNINNFGVLIYHDMEVLAQSTHLRRATFDTKHTKTRHGKCLHHFPYLATQFHP